MKRFDDSSFARRRLTTRPALRGPDACGTPGQGLLAAVLALVLCAAARADTVQFTPSADTGIYENTPTLPSGSSATMVAGGVGPNAGETARRALLRFGLPGSIPAGATVTSVTVTVRVVFRLPPTPVDSNFQLRRLLRAWTEGGATWSWPVSFSAPWGAPGAGDASDASPSASASVPVSGFGTYTFASTPALVADVQAWLNNPADNHGWLLVSDTEAPFTARHFATREDAANAPVLTVGYSAPNAPPTVTVINPTNNATFNAPASVTIEAVAQDNDGLVTGVQFFDGATLLGSATGPNPYSLVANLSPGSHALSAVATDNLGATGTSAVVNVTVVTVPIDNPIAERIPKGDITVELRPIADGMASPIGMAVPDDGSGRMFVYDQVGVVWVVTASGRLPTPLLDLRTRLVNISGNYDERGLLGLATHPNFAQNPLIYTYTSEPNAGPADFPSTLNPGTTNNHQSVIAEWRLDPSTTNQVNPATRREVMRIDQPQSNHNGGIMRFGPDDLLYVSLGDGGQADDQGNGHSPGGNAQDTTNLLGTLIRIDVDGRNSANGQYGVPSDNPFVGGPGADEIYAFGLRNAFGFSFDRTTGLLYLGDVGQNKIEEINLISKGSNYGWNIKEGSFYFDPRSPTQAGHVTLTPVRPVPPDLVDPIAEYDHDDGTAIIGGYVYRGSQVPALAGRYVFGDWGIFGSPSGRLYYLDANSAIKELRLGLEDRPLGQYLKGFGEDAAGELYIFTSKPQGPTGIGGTMYKIVPPPASALEVASGTVTNGTNFQTVVSGGLGPFVQQRKAAVTELVWMDEAAFAGNGATVRTFSPHGFFRHADTARQPAVPFSALLSGANERPAPITTDGEGFGLFRLEGNSLTFTITYRNLGSEARMAHIHGPSPASGSAGVLLDLAPFHNGPFGTSGSFSGTLVLSDAHKAHLLGGRTYVNIHTVNHGGGEIRGQIAPVLLEASLLGAYEPSAVRTPASGLGSFTLVGNQLTFNITYRDLSGPANAAHFHASAPLGQNAGVIIDLAPFKGGPFGSSGSVSGTTTLSAAHLAAFVDGLAYVNFHTTANPGGEIRGQVLPKVTAVPLTAFISGLNERPTPLTNTAAGHGIFSLENDWLAFSITYSGLSGPATAAHIHGPASFTNNAGVSIDLGPYHIGDFDTNGAFSGAVRLTPAQRTMILNGLAYFNIHTPNHPGGEARGQLASVLMLAGADGPAERPAAVVSAGSALGLFTLTGAQLHLNVVYKGLSGTASDAHIHAPASASGTAGVVLGFGPFNGGAWGASGSLTGSTLLTPTVLGYLIDGVSYVNFHTTAYPSGEIRGQIIR
jgi:glucose/arabinose dehydrogenase